MSSPERGTRGSYEEPYYSQYGTRGGSVTPIIDEEHRYQLQLKLKLKKKNNKMFYFYFKVMPF